MLKVFSVEFRIIGICEPLCQQMLVGWFMVFNVTFNNFPVISWQSVLLVEKTGVTGENRSNCRKPVTCLHCCSCLYNADKSLYVECIGKISFTYLMKNLREAMVVQVVISYGH
jgi:hypothetical protein